MQERSECCGAISEKLDPSHSGLRSIERCDHSGSKEPPRFRKAFQAWTGGGRLNREQCHGRATVCATGTGMGADPLVKTMGGATTATGAAECITTHRGQWSESAATGCTWATCTNVSRVSSNRQTNDVARKAQGLPPTRRGLLPMRKRNCL